MVPSPNPSAWLEGRKHSRLVQQPRTGVDYKVLAALHAQEGAGEDQFQNGAVEIVDLLYRPEGLG